MRRIKLLNPEKATAGEVKKYRVRKAARAVVIDSKNRVALLLVAKNGYYKMPGGGLEGKEDPIVALKRECKEEIGCRIKVLEELGRIVEHRKMFKLKQISYCYLAQVVGKKGKTAYTAKEKKEGFKVVWLPYAEALEKFKKNNALNREGKLYIGPRDKLVLENAGLTLN